MKEIKIVVHIYLDQNIQIKNHKNLVKLKHINYILDKYYKCFI